MGDKGSCHPGDVTELELSAVASTGSSTYWVNLKADANGWGGAIVLTIRTNNRQRCFMYSETVMSPEGHFGWQHKAGLCSSHIQRRLHLKTAFLHKRSRKANGQPSSNDILSIIFLLLYIHSALKIRLPCRKSWALIESHQLNLNWAPTWACVQ